MSSSSSSVLVVAAVLVHAFAGVPRVLLRPLVQVDERVLVERWLSREVALVVSLRLLDWVLVFMAAGVGLLIDKKRKETPQLQTASERSRCGSPHTHAPR